MKKLLIIPTLIALWTTLLPAASAATDPLAVSLSERWAQITYQQPKQQHKQLLNPLYIEARTTAATHSNNAEVLSWAGIITASYAGAKGGLGALKLAKEARSQLQAALEIDPEALNGGARTSLGVLYYQVPPWPVGFGNVNRAEKLLAESYEKHPSNLDVVYFYADFLHSQKRMKGARTLLHKARALSVRAHREVADTGRQHQVTQKLALIDAAAS